MQVGAGDIRCREKSGDIQTDYVGHVRFQLCCSFQLAHGQRKDRDSPHRRLPPNKRGSARSR